MIKGQNISCTFKTKKGSLPVLKGVSFELSEGRITTFMGQSGAGKTTLLRCLANLEPHYSGQITCNGQDIQTLNPVQRATTIGFVLQQFHLFPHLTVLDNCTYALKTVVGLEVAEADARALETLTKLGIGGLAHSLPAQLSGGQQQRVAIARALVMRPQVLLLDEPTSALDPESKKGLEALLLALHAEGVTIALSSHDMPFIRRIMDRVYFLETGELIESWDKETDDLSSKIRINQFISHA